VEVPPGLSLEDDLVLPEDNKQRLRELAGRIRLRHVVADLHGDQLWRSPPGVVSMFVGSSGTGKTYAATCLASSLSLDLMRVDLPRVVSKWVGETEKNLQQVFAEAEDGNAIIFFDEADAFFGKRGEVKDAQDRWANMEVNYLLQRIEEYDGAVVLATNLRQNIDEAFLRRIQVVIEFPFPDARQRELLWQRALAQAVPHRSADQIAHDFDVNHLAQSFSLSGAAIQSVVGAAELRALAESGNGSASLTRSHLDSALRRELEKSGHSLQALEVALHGRDRGQT
jgi:SpoVK/Ycf46/Vps4 family AAA+-type ATPase